MAKNRKPIIGKGVSFPFKIAVASWMDLLGYGGMIADAKFNPFNASAKKATKRLKNFHKIVSEHSNRTFPTLILNDGAVAYRDLSFRSKSNSYDFLIRSWKLFSAISKAEKEQSYPGLRMVLAVGFRWPGRRSGLDANLQYARETLEKFKQNKITEQQAIGRFASRRASFDIIPQLQANYAFTKAYVAEQSGSKGGLPGANMYIDTNLFNDSKPNWINFNKAVSWSHIGLGLAGTFLSVINIIPPKLSTEAPKEMLDALGVAKKLSGDKNVLAALRAAKKNQTKK